MQLASVGLGQTPFAGAKGEKVITEQPTSCMFWYVGLMYRGEERMG